jgi:hypothetical protein
MRAKSENEARDRYARRYAAVLAAEHMIRLRNAGRRVSITLEAEDNPHWDDIHEVWDNPTEEHRHQVKRQQTPIPAIAFGEYFTAALELPPETWLHFTFPVLVEVENVGEIRILRTLTNRIQQSDVNEGKVLGNLRPAEQKWIDWIKAQTGLSDMEVLALLKRVKLDIIGFEEDLDARALRTLVQIFGGSAEKAWETIVKYAHNKDGVVDISPDTLWNLMPPPVADEVETFYSSIIAEIENRFWLTRWDGVSDLLVRNLMPLEFHDDVLNSVHAVHTSSWSGRHPMVEAAIRNLADRASDYLDHFDSRSELDGSGTYIRENLSYKRNYPNPYYHEEVEAAKKWDRGVAVRLWNMTIALNQFFAAIRQEIWPEYRLREGRLAISDSTGTRHDGLTGVYHTVSEDYLPIPED